MSLLTSPQTGVAIPQGFRKFEGDCHASVRTGSQWQYNFKSVKFTFPQHTEITNAKTAAYSAAVSATRKEERKKWKRIGSKFIWSPGSRAGNRQGEETETLGGVFRFILCMALLYPVNIKEKSEKLLSSCEVMWSVFVFLGRTFHFDTPTMQNGTSVGCEYIRTGQPENWA